MSNSSPLSASARPSRLPDGPDEQITLECVCVAVGGPTPWVRLTLIGRGFQVVVAPTSFDLARLAGKWLYRPARAVLELTRGADGRIEGGLLHDLDLIDAPSVPDSVDPAART